jgi:hypothetical protein
MLIIIAFISFSCSGRSNNIYVDTLKKEAIVLDSISIMKYTADELLERNGNPISDINFPAYQAGRDKRSIFQFYPRDSKDIIRELYWNIDDTTYLLIWYNLKDSSWVPFTFYFYDTRDEY